MKVRFVNPAAEALLQQPADAVLNTELNSPFTVGEIREVTFPGTQTEPVIAEMRVAKILWGGRLAALATLRNVSARKKIEETLQRAKEAAEREGQTATATSGVLWETLRARDS